MIARLILLLIVVLNVACWSDHDVSDNEFPSRSVTLNGREYKYRIYVPADLKRGVPTPVMLYLHGSGARGDDNRSQLGEFPSFIRENKQQVNLIVVFPQCRPETFWAGEMAEQAMAALEQTVGEFNGDRDRLYLAGYSMGAYGTWQLGVTYPKKFAALVPIAGGIVPNGPVSDEDMAKLSPAVLAAARSNDPYEAFAAAIGDTPVWVFHGGNDDVVPVEGSRKIVEVMKARGNANVRYTELENVKHNSLFPALRAPDLFGWLLQQRLSAHGH